jgi:hypothetical protein
MKPKFTMKSPPTMRDYLTLTAVILILAMTAWGIFFGA